MIVDIHTHIFPPALIAARGRLAASEPGFAELYADPKAKMATAEDLLDAMADAGVDVSVACGFWWRDPALAAEHAAYLVDAASRSEGRIVAFVSAFDAPAGAAGIGEVRVTDPAHIVDAGLPLLVHCSEEAGHAYPGKSGGLSPAGVTRLLEEHPGVRVVAAHWGAGLPFFALMPEVRALFDAGRLLVDSAASAFLYRPEVFGIALQAAGSGAVAWGSDFPLRGQRRDLQDTRDALAGLDERTREAVLGGNAARFLRLAGAAG